MGSSFGDKAIRRAFIKKVYGILSVQLIVTMGIIAIFIYPPQIREYVQRNQWVYWSSFGLMLVSYCECMTKTKSVRKLVMVILRIFLKRATSKCLKYFFRIYNTVLGVKFCGHALRLKFLLCDIHDSVYFRHV